MCVNQLLYQLLKMCSVAFTMNSLWVITSTNISKIGLIHSRNNGLLFFLTKLQLPEEKGAKPCRLKVFPKHCSYCLTPDDRNSVVGRV